MTKISTESCTRHEAESLLGEGGQVANSGRFHSRSLILVGACPFCGET
jgi:hypothetical protein